MVFISNARLSFFDFMLFCYTCEISQSTAVISSKEQVVRKIYILCGISEEAK